MVEEGRSTLPHARTRTHKGDIMPPETRSRVMSRIRGRDTGPERIAAGLLDQAGLECETQARDLPGRPDFVLRDVQLAVFVDGAFWHGWQFAARRHKLSEMWEAKIDATRRRDWRNRSALRAMGWRVLRLWDFELERDPGQCLARIVAAVQSARDSLAAAAEIDYTDQCAE